MDAETWQEHNHRPVWVRENREAINDHTDLSEPVPDGSNYEIREWLARYKGTVTRQLSDGESGKDADAETEGEQ